MRSGVPNKNAVARLTILVEPKIFPPKNMLGWLRHRFKAYLEKNVNKIAVDKSTHRF